MVCWSEKERLAWKPRRPEQPDVWARKNVKLTREMGCVPGRYNPDRTPWVIPLLRALASRQVENVVFMAASQIGKSLTAQVFVGWCIAEDPANLIYFSDTDNNARFASESRIQTMIDGNEVVRDRIESERKRKWERVRCDGMNMYFSGAGSSSQVASKSANRVVRDETAKWRLKQGDEAGALENAAQRVEGQYWSMIFDISTPAVEDDPIMKTYAKSDKRNWLVPCPFCGCYQKLEWKRFGWPKGKDGKSVPPAEARNNCWYKCERCGQKVREHHKIWMVQHGKAVAADEKVSQRKAAVDSTRYEPGGLLDRWRIKLPVDGKYMSYTLEGKVVTTRFGLQVSRLYSPFRSWGSIVEKWLESQNDLSALQAFYNSTLAEPWRYKIEKIDEAKILRIIDPTLKRKVVPDDTVAVIVGADCHGERLNVRYVMAAFNKDLAVSVIDNGELLRVDDLGKMSAAPLFFADGRQTTISGIFCDARYKTHDVFMAAARHLGIMPVFGRGSAMTDLYAIKPIEKSTIGRNIPGGLSAMYINVDAWKDMTYKHIQMELGDDLEAIALARRYGHHQLRVYAEPDEEMIDALTSQQKLTVTNKYGFKRSEWKVVKPDKDHYWDCIIYLQCGGRWLVPQLVESEIRKRQEEFERHRIEAGRRAELRRPDPGETMNWSQDPNKR